ncbi:MAG TPA: 2Fe-2S iron-sulfur cluster-binding protein, partial [Lacunisphaera sp.]|nr:2Fe-2S iron-sulfur cluster-binding protein [Lacunisphaera sp.]
MSVELHFNGHVTTIGTGESLFTHAERLGLQVPTSCNKQGKCKECVVEVVEGLEHLSAPAPAERHLKGLFRLSCCARVKSDAGLVRCHTMRRGEMRIEKHAFALPTGARRWALDPAVTRDGDRILLDGTEIDRGTGPLHGLAIDLGTTTIVMRLLDLETGEVVADSSFENPQRFGGSDVMARIQYDTEDPTRTLQRTLVGYLARAIQEFPV